MFVNDAFGSAHRAHCSTEGVSKYLSPSVAGFLLQKELTYLQVPRKKLNSTLYLTAILVLFVTAHLALFCRQLQQLKV